jgi:cytochrome P450
VAGLEGVLSETPVPPPAGALPPGPTRPGFVQTLEWIRDPAAFLDRCAAEFGTTFTVRLGPATVVMMSDPADVGKVLHGPPDRMHMGDINGLFRRVLGRDSLLVIDDDAHMRMRKLLLPPFRGARIAEHRDAMVTAAEESLADWPRDTPFALHPRMQQITLDVMLRAIFGLERGPRRDELRALLIRLLDGCTTMAITLPVLRREVFGLSPWGRLMRTTAEVDRALYAEITRRRAEGADRGDVLSLLLAATDESGEPMDDTEVRNQLLTMLVAGYETTATALAWTFERLLRHPDVLARLREDIDGGSTTYLDAVIKEAQRLRPTLPIAARKLVTDYEVGGRVYPARTVLMPCMYLLHRNPAVWAEPEAFRPERFLSGSVPTHAWMPFGGGVRRCLGAGFAQAEMRLVMQTVLEQVDLRAADPRDESIVRRSFTLSPARSTRVVATARRG